MRPRAPSACATATAAPIAWPSGMIIMKSSRMNVMSVAIVIVPAATCAPPTPSTAMNATCMTMLATGTTNALIFAMSRPRR